MPERAGVKGHAVCMCCIERTHPPGEEPTIALGSRATFGEIHACAECGSLCTLTGCYGRNKARREAADAS